MLAVDARRHTRSGWYATNRRTATSNTSSAWPQPVASVRPGDIIDTRTVDCFGNVIQNPATHWPRSRETTLDRPLFRRRGGAGGHAGRHDLGSPSTAIRASARWRRGSVRSTPRTTRRCCTRLCRRKSGSSRSIARRTKPLKALDSNSRPGFRFIPFSDAWEWRQRSSRAAR